MQCPIDGTPLVISDRSGVEIDFCPTCRGVWLDRGELDKIIERAGAYSAAPPPPPPPGAGRAAPQRDHGPSHGYDEHAPSHGYDAQRGRKKKGMGDFLGDIFDF
jgi:hypothetical protein